MKQPSMSHALPTKCSCMNSSPEQQPNTVEWLQPPQLRHASTTPTPCWFTNPDFSRALLHEQVTGISGWQGEAIPPRVEQYSQLHKEKAKGLFWTLAIPKRFRWIHVFSFWCHDLEILLLFPPFPMEEHPWFPSLPSWSDKFCWICWRPKSQSLPMGPTPVSGGKVEFVSMEAT